MIRRPPRSTRTDTLFPYTTLFRAGKGGFIRVLLPAAGPKKAGAAGRGAWWREDAREPERLKFRAIFVAPQGRRAAPDNHPAPDRVLPPPTAAFAILWTRTSIRRRVTPPGRDDSKPALRS